MALTITEGAKLSTDVLLQGVAETIVKDSPVLQMMPFIDIQGNSLLYNRENAAAAAAWQAVGDTWTESTPTFTQKSSALKILGGDADVDNYIRSTRGNVQDAEAAIIELKAKSVRQAFETAFIYGNAATDPNQFDGLARLIDTATAGNQLIAMGATGATLTLAKLEELIDAIRGGKPSLLLMSRRSRRKINALVRAAGGVLESWPVGQGEAGGFVQLYNGIPIGVSDYILDTHTLAGSVETAYAGAANSTIYALSFGEGAIAGIQGAGGLTVERMGNLETKDASRTRIKWYCGLCDFSAVKRAALIGVQD